MSSLARFAGPKPPTRSSPASNDFVDESQTHETSGGWSIAGIPTDIPMRGLFTIALLVMTLTIAIASDAFASEGQMTWALHFSPTPTWFDPAEASATTTSYNSLYALHDAMIRPSPGQPMAPSLAESWSVSPDGLAYEFVLRKGVKFHNGDPVGVEDVKFSFERYRGLANKMLKERVAAIEISDPGRIRFRLKQAWPDFMTFYSSATAAGWIVPKKYI